jgi:hypothetical protein
MDFEINYEIVGDDIYCHSRIFRWTPSIKREYIAYIKEEAKNEDYPIVYCNIPLKNKKLNKFVKQIGFKFVRAYWAKEGCLAIYRMDTKCYK